METNNQELNNFIYRLRNADLRYASLSKALQIIYWVLIAIYLVLLGVHIAYKEPVIEIIGSICFLCGMFVFVLVFRTYTKEYQSIDYALPTLVMLKKAVYRYQPFQRTLWIVLIAVLFFDAGLSCQATTLSGFIWLQVAFFCTMFGAVLVGLWIWRIRYKPLRDEALRLIHDIEA